MTPLPPPAKDAYIILDLVTNTWLGDRGEFCARAAKAASLFLLIGGC